MTAEVVLMNKQAVALAADSAGTIGTAPEVYIPMEFPYIEKKVDWVTPAIEIFKNEWKNTEYVKKYGINYCCSAN